MQVKTIRAEGLHISGQASMSGWAPNSLWIEFELPVRPPQKIGIAGTAEWMEKLPMSQEYLVGVSIDFARMEDEDRKQLKTYLGARR